MKKPVFVKNLKNPGSLTRRTLPRRRYHWSRLCPKTWGGGASTREGGEEEREEEREEEMEE